jgi:hypothetical protein
VVAKAANRAGQLICDVADESTVGTQGDCEWSVTDVKPSVGVEHIIFWLNASDVVNNSDIVDIEVCNEDLRGGTFWPI